MANEDLQKLVRDLIGRPLRDHVSAPREPGVDLRDHASHHRLPLQSGDVDGACLIEPAVPCNRCGYCLSLGH